MHLRRGGKRRWRAAAHVFKRTLGTFFHQNGLSLVKFYSKCARAHTFENVYQATSTQPIWKETTQGLQARAVNVQR